MYLYIYKYIYIYIGRIHQCMCSIVVMTCGAVHGILVDTFGQASSGMMSPLVNNA